MKHRALEFQIYNDKLIYHRIINKNKHFFTVLIDPILICIALF